MQYEVRIFQRNRDGCLIVKAEAGELLTSLLEKNGVGLPVPCGGRGLCGKCMVRIKGKVRPPLPFEEESLGFAGIREGYRLACLYKVDSDIDVYVDYNTKGQIMTDMVMLPFDLEPLILSPNGHGEYYGIAYDIGTTTIAGYLVNIKDGRIVDSISAINAQRAYGSDVLARISYALEKKEGFEKLKQAVCRQLASLSVQLAEKNNIGLSSITCVSIAGNTVMLHLLQGYDVTGLAAQPFRPVNLAAVKSKAGELGIFTGEYASCPVYILPCISAFAGADVTAAILAAGIAESSKLSLLIDIGTNGELVLGNRDRLLCCSAAAGPAFEGASIKHGTGGIEGAIDSVKISGGQVKITTIGKAEPIGICGSGIVDAVAELLKEGIIDYTGKMKMPEFVLYEKATGGNISITARDIREVQLAKAAIAAGVNLLLKEMGAGADEVERVFIAGGFGNYMNRENMFKIGLLRNEFRDKVIGLGNAAGAGAVRALLSGKAYRDCLSIAERCEYKELSGREDFQEEFVANMFFRN